MTDGSTHHQQLQEIFLRVTGTDVCIETQEQTVDSDRNVDADGTTTAEYVSTMVQEDGLSETLAEPAQDGAPE